MRVLSIDVESYSEVDIDSCGAYRYVDDPSFELLLFAYSVDYGPVTVIDLVNGEQVPSHIISALEDPSVTKTAFNANFERVCLTKWFGFPNEPELWECTMVLAAQMGLPLSLAGVSSAMGLPDDKSKLKDGKDLIRYFCLPCKPTKANGGRTRNMPFDDLEKWDRFVEYNRRDVEAENYIRQTLERYRPNPSEQRMWQLDQHINDKGVPVDLTLARNAIQFDEKYKAELEKEAIALSGLDNPNSVSQIKDWLLNLEGIEVESLNKKAMPEVMEQVENDHVREFLEIRKELSKSSTKKYDAIVRSVCSDGRIRGLFQFYGANRTGRFCLAEGTPVLVRTPNGVVVEKPIQLVSDDDMVWDGDVWVRHEGVVYSGDKEVITYDGVTATRDHYVFISSDEKIRLEDAMEKGVILWRGNTPSIE